MTRRQFNQLINKLDGKNPFIVLHRDAVAPKYVGVEVSKEGVVYNYSVISVMMTTSLKRLLFRRY